MHLHLGHVKKLTEDDHCSILIIVEFGSHFPLFFDRIELFSSMFLTNEYCKENGPLTHLLWILVFDDQHN